MFQYKIHRVGKYRGGTKPKVSKIGEVLTGTLQGKTNVPADEERFYYAANKTGKVRDYYVEFDIGARCLPGSRTLDALVNTDFGWRAFEIDGAAFVHRGAAKKAQDRLNDLQRMDGLKKLGIVPRNGIEHIPDTKLMTQDQADRTARLLL